MLNEVLWFKYFITFKIAKPKTNNYKAGKLVVLGLGRNYAAILGRKAFGLI
jgi:hypothetical protein